MKSQKPNNNAKSRPRPATNPRPCQLWPYQEHGPEWNRHKLMQPGMETPAKQSDAKEGQSEGQSPPQIKTNQTTHQSPEINAPTTPRKTSESKADQTTPPNQ
jgi:hypothetical protein